MINIIGKRYLFIGLSLLIIIPGLIILAVMAIQGNLPMAIDFTGGSLLELKFADGKLPSTDEVLKVYAQQEISDVSVQTTDQGSIIIRSTYLEDPQRTAVLQSMQSKSSENIEVLRFENVGPLIGKEVATRAALAVSIAALIVVVYMTYAFRGMQHSLRYGICAIIAMFHDVAIVLSITAIGSLLFGWQIDALFLTALLTVIGFSVQDKVVVFDRIRENSTIYRKLQFETLVNHSIVQTLQRSINTQLMTVEFMLLSLALFGGVTLREFAIILLVGLLSGTYSSIFTASPILVIWENKEWKNWFRPKQKALEQG
jgi:preprotein translocase subunit SecF